MISTETRKTQLLTRLADLKSRLEGIENTLEGHDSKDWEDMATEREEDEVLEGIGESGLQEIRRIEAALNRVEAGEYGLCTKCGERISEERLDVLPWTPFCRTHAA